MTLEEIKQKHFVTLDKEVPSIEIDLRYYSTDNFIGRRIKGYEANICFVTHPMAKALGKIQSELNKENLGLKVFDAYRPQMAVNDFIEWAKDLSDQKMKDQYYPHMKKEDLFKGYLSRKSAHSRGSAIDLTLIQLSNKHELPMGTLFDFFDERSHTSSQEITKEEQKNRMFLVNRMKKYGLKNYSKEWWHFQLVQEPFPKEYFNFPIR